MMSQIIWYFGWPYINDSYDGQMHYFSMWESIIFSGPHDAHFFLENVENWTGLMWLRIGQVVGTRECSDEPSGSINAANFWTSW